jgi:hypothetical protein
MENPDFGPLRSSGSNLEKLRLAFRDAGVTFSDADGKECVCFDPAKEGVRPPDQLRRGSSFSERSSKE